MHTVQLHLACLTRSAFGAIVSPVLANVAALGGRLCEDMFLGLRPASLVQPRQFVSSPSFVGEPFTGPLKIRQFSQFQSQGKIALVQAYLPVVIR